MSAYPSVAIQMEYTSYPLYSSSSQPNTTANKRRQEDNQKPHIPIKQVRENSGCWLSGYLLSEKMAPVRKNDGCTPYFPLH